MQTRSFALGSGFSLPHFLLYYSMRLVPYAAPRRIVASALAGGISMCRRLSRFEPPGAPPASEAALAALRRCGIASLDPLLSVRQIEEIRAYLADQRVVSGDRSFFAAQAPEGIARAAYPLETVLACPHVLETINRTDCLALARAYLGCTPTASLVGIAWSFAAQGGYSDVQCFHRDPDDWRFLKLFVHLSDVGAANGPHEYVERTHLTSGEFRTRLYPDEEVEARYGKHRIRQVLGPAGTSFAADTWGVHKGGVPRCGRRLMLQFQYSILPVAKFAYAPRKVSRAAGFDRYTNRLLVC